MKSQVNALAVAVVLACASGSAAVAADGVKPASQVDGTGTRVAAAESGAFTQAVQQQEALLARERRLYPGLFRIAYARYPKIPAGTLEALAYTQSRWHHLRPDRADGAPDAHMPQAWGVMGLYAGDGFADQVGEAAAVLRISPEQIKTDPLSNILAAAALLDRQLVATSISQRSGPAGLAPALQRYAGFSAGTGEIQDYARASFAFDVMLALDRGVDDNGIKVPERAVEWERAFAPDALVKLNAPMVRLDVRNGTVEAGGYAVDASSEQLVRATPDRGAGLQQRAATAAVDFPGARWVYSPNFNSRDGTAISEMVIHTMQGSYAGSISWFENSESDVSSHYLIRSSDGQVTQMVRESNRAWHAGSHNSHALGIEHEGYISNPSWYTAAMYNSSAAITRQSCKRYPALACTKTMRSWTSAKLSDSNYKVLGHENLTNNSHTDPGRYWNWANYYKLVNPGTPPGTGSILDSFESSVGHFNTSPTYSGSTVGISTASTSARNCSTRHGGNCSLNVKLVDNPATSANWSVRLLSGAGTPSANTGISRNSQVGFWVLSGGSGMSVGITIDDGAGTERSVPISIPANQWTYVSWNLNNANNFNAWAGSSNGSVDAATVTLDGIWFYRAQTRYNVQLYVDDVQVKAL